MMLFIKCFSKELNRSVFNKVFNAGVPEKVAAYAEKY